MIKIKSDKIITENKLCDGFIYVDGDKILEITDRSYDVPELYDFTGMYVSPGFIDIHTHGAGGYSFINSDADEVAAGCNYMLRFGTTALLPTVSSGSFPTMRNATREIKKAKDSGKVLSHIIGAHLEGPYLSAEQNGAQCPAFITRPIEQDYIYMLDEYWDTVKRWTYAPENDDGGRFCRYLTSHGVIASAGHTNAKYADMSLAIENGCRLVTHLYSCTSTVTREHGFRIPGVVESVFLRDELYAEIIADGKHLPPEMIRMIVKIKGFDKVICCTDSLSIAGTDILSGEMNGTKYIVEDGVCKLKSREAFAGSVATADKLVRCLVKECGFTVADSVKMLTKNPAELFSLNKGKLAAGYDADIIVFDEDISVSDVMVDGRLITF